MNYFEKGTGFIGYKASMIVAGLVNPNDVFGHWYYQTEKEEYMPNVGWETAIDNIPVKCIRRDDNQLLRRCTLYFEKL